MSIFTDENEADKAVIGSLLKELSRRKTVSHYLKLTDGRLIRTDEFTVVEAQEVQTVIDQCEAEASHLKSLIAVEPEQPAEAPATEPAPEVLTEAPIQPAEAPTQIEVNGQAVPANEDGTINIDVTPEAPAATEPAPQPEPTTDPVLEAAGVTQAPQDDTTTSPAPVVLQ